jgi:hypothetical protein
LAKGLDAEQFWVFKNVKALLARNEAGDLDQATQLMSGIGFTAVVRDIVLPVAPAPVAAPVAAAAHGAEEHGHVHLPNPSYWPLLLALSIGIAFSGLLVLQTTLAITAIGLILAFLSAVAFSLEPTGA